MCACPVKYIILTVMSTEYNLRNKTGTMVVDELSITQKVLERLLLSEEFVTKISSKISEKVSSFFQNQVDNLNRDVSQLRAELSVANKKIESLEQYSRPNNLRIYGIKEQRAEDVGDVIVGLCKEKLGMAIRTQDIDIAHRLQAKEGGIRPIIVRFLNRSVKKKIFSNKTKLKGSKIIIKEDLTPFKVSLLKKLASCSSNRTYWTNDGKVFSKMGNIIHHINSFDDIENVWGKKTHNSIETDSGTIV